MLLHYPIGQYFNRPGSTILLSNQKIKKFIIKGNKLIFT